MTDETWVRALKLILAITLLALATSVASILFGGCSVDSAGLAETKPLARGQNDASGVADIGRDGGSRTESLNQLDATDDQTSGKGTNDDGHAAEADVSSSTSDASSSELNSGADAASSLLDASPDLTPSECPVEAGTNRSITQCDATTQICRYYDAEGHPSYVVGCMAEGKLCVRVCS